MSFKEALAAPAGTIFETTSVYERIQLEAAGYHCTHSHLQTNYARLSRIVGPQFRMLPNPLRY